MFLLLSLVIPAQAGWQWGVPEGGATMKFLSVPLSARAAAFSGGGSAAPQLSGEIFSNPLAAVAVSEPVVGISQVLLAERIGGTLTGIHAVYPGTSWSWSGGLLLLNYDDIAGRDDDGLVTDDYGAGAYAVQLGVATRSGALELGLSGRFAAQNIAGYHSRALLADAAAGFQLNRYLRFAAVLTNWGWVEPYDGYAESAPMALQAGLSSAYALSSGFRIRVHGDLYRRTDTDAMALLGGELAYREILTLALGYPLRSGSSAGPNAGLSIQAGAIGVGYAYETHTALKGNHHFDLTLKF